jgi:uncharacterized membrane protein
MNDQERSELEWLKRRHAKLEEDLALLAKQLKLVEERLKVRTETPVAAEVKPIVEPGKSTLEPAQPPPIPPVFPQTTIPKPTSLKSKVAAPKPAEPTATVLPPPKISPAFSPVSASAPQEKRSFEMRLGTYWLVRIGIVMVLTALVFFGNYAYQNFIGQFGPAGKVSLLYLASGLLLGAGTWWQRKAVTESLRNYAQVLFAGGLAAVYFTTYAAHHMPALRIIPSPLIDGALLLGWAAFMVWIADHKKSEVLALFAVGLAYYTSVITRVGAFTLYSNLILTAAAVFFLIRNRWAVLSVASLAATYASYGFWRFFDGSGWHWASPDQGLWFGAYFLVSYWALFTAAVFLCKEPKFAGPNRAGFLTFNNVAFFSLFLMTMHQVNVEGFWKFALIYGSTLLALTELARRVLPNEPLTKNSYLTQGLLLVTVGIISKFAGLQLALLLGAESVVLLTLGMMRNSLILQTGAYISGALAIGWGIDGLKRNDWHSMLLETTLGVLMVFNAFWSHLRTRESKAIVRVVPAFFTVLALIIWVPTTWYNTDVQNFPLALAIEAVALTFSIYLLRVRELTLFGQSYALIAQCAWLVHSFEPNVRWPWWNPALLIAITLGLSHWWQRQKAIVGGTSLAQFWQGLYALALIGVLHFWLRPLNSPATWLVLTSALAVGITAYGVVTRSWFLAACSQIFLAISIGQFALQLWQLKPQWFFPLAPLAALGLLSFATVNWFQRKPDSGAAVRESLLQFAMVYRWVALLMSLWWVQEYIPAWQRIWFLAALGFAVFLFAGWQKSREAVLFSATFTAAALALFWIPRNPTAVYLPNLLAILGVLAQQRIAKRLPERFSFDRNVHGALIIVGGLSLWLLLTRWISQSSGGFYLTAGWSALALVLFTCGIVLRERVYRWLGLAVLACALGRVVIFDVWKLETIYRILSFMALGVVLLVLRFIYNKYQEKIREWL